ncbi:MAG: ATP-binding protein [Culicoidibacterales bacterium]
MKRRITIKRKLFLNIGLLLFFVMAIIAALNIFALKPFYIWQKTNELKRESQQLQEQTTIANFVDYTYEELQKQNIQVNIYQANGTVLFQSDTQVTIDDTQFLTQFGDLPVSRKQRGTKVTDYFDVDDLAELENSAFLVDTQNDDQVLAIGTRYLADYYLILQTPLVAITANIELFNQFLFLGFMLALGVGWIWSLLLARQFSRPIQKLQLFAQSVKNRDFSQQWTSKRTDELGDLGENMNQLAQMLDELVTQLETKNQLLANELNKKEELEKLQRQFISDVSHELKTPLALIQGYSEGIIDGIADTAATRQEYAEIIVDETKVMQQLIEELLQLAKLDSPMNRFNLTTFDLAELVHQVNDRYRHLGETQQFTLIETLIPVEVTADKKQIEQVLTNYVTNAIRHVQPNGVIRINLEMSGEVVRVGVYNDGQKIPEAILPYIWQRFYKADQSRIRGNGGSGLGLAIVTGIIANHQGEYGVYNTDEGVMFWFSLPLTRI